MMSCQKVQCYWAFLHFRAKSTLF